MTDAHESIALDLWDYDDATAAIIKTYLTALTDDPAMVDKIAELQANGWAHGTHPREKATIVLTAIKEAAGV
jgi:hypothetical protein